MGSTEAANNHLGEMETAKCERLFKGSIAAKYISTELAIICSVSSAPGICACEDLGHHGLLD